MNPQLFGATIPSKWNTFVMMQQAKQQMPRTSVFQATTEARTRPISTVTKMVCPMVGKLSTVAGLALHLLEEIIGHLTLIVLKTHFGMRTATVSQIYVNTNGRLSVVQPSKASCSNHMVKRLTQASSGLNQTQIILIQMVIHCRTVGNPEAPVLGTHHGKV